MEISDSDCDLVALDRLGSDPKLRELQRYVPTLSIMRAIGKERDELAHSDLLAVLFDPDRHRSAPTAVHAFLRHIAERLVSQQHPEGSRRERIMGELEGLLSADHLTVKVHRERFFIDLVLEIRGAAHRLVVGIENKVDAGERDGQLADYQRRLARRYGGSDSLLVFLTPDGRSATSAEDLRVPSVSLAYRAVVGAIREVQGEIAPRARDWIALEEMARHIEEEIVNDERDEVRRRVHELWREYPEALRRVIQHRPRLRDIRESFETKLEARLRSELKLWVYPVNRAEIREIKARPKHWEATHPFTFMLHTNSHGPDLDGRPRLRLLINQDDFDRHSERLEQWAIRANDRLASEGTSDVELDPSFPALPHWSYWRRVLREDDYPDSAVIDEVTLGDETAERAADEVANLVEALDPLIREEEPPESP